MSLEKKGDQAMGAFKSSIEQLDQPSSLNLNFRKIRETQII